MCQRWAGTLIFPLEDFLDRFEGSRSQNAPHDSLLDANSQQMQATTLEELVCHPNLITPGRVDTDPCLRRIGKVVFTEYKDEDFNDHNSYDDGLSDMGMSDCSISHSDSGDESDEKEEEEELSSEGCAGWAE